MLEQILEKLDVAALFTRMTAYLPNVIAAAAMLVVFWLVLAVVRRMLSAALAKAGVQPAARTLIQRFIKYGIVTLAFLTVADQLGFNVTSLLTGLGIAGLALSLAAQDTVTNIIAGITILIDRPFSRGDWIRLTDLHALVTDIRLRTTILTTFDNETIVVPNRQLLTERIVNYTLTRQVRVRVPLGIAYKEDIGQARDALLRLPREDPRILNEPAPSLIVTGLGDSSVDLELRLWVEDPMQMFSLQWEYTEKCKRALDEAGIEIPFPHMHVVFDEPGGPPEPVRSQLGA